MRGGASLRRLLAHQTGQRRDALGGPVEAEPIAEICEEGDAELATGLHQPEHDVARLAAIGAFPPYAPYNAMGIYARKAAE